MLRCTPALLGRWSSRDFLRGRSKRAGAVHTRHTHGRQGRFKRLSTKYSSIRDGRRHASNHMQGGLGIKLGGGLFGLRIPRQHQLSHLSRDDFELEVYGHPNITNPYREHLNEHPDLKSVMMNAEVAVQMVVLMPRVGRGNDAARADRGASAPESWLRVVREVSAAVEVLAPPPPLLPPQDDVALDASPSPPVEVHFTTLETSVCCRWPPSAETPVSPNLAAQLEASAPQLYSAHCRLGQTLRLVQMKEKTAASSSSASRTTASPSTSLPRHSGRRPAVFMGAALKAPASHSSSAIGGSGGGMGAASAGGSFTSSVLAQLTREAAASSGSTSSLPSCADGVMGRAPLDAPAVPFTDGVVSVVHRLTSTERPILRVCMRPTKGEKASSTHDAPAATPAAAVPQRKVLKADIDPHAEIGVWTLPRSPLQELLRWHYCAHDPRAHNHDALPHHRRSLPLLLVVDYSTIDHSSGLAAAAASAMSARRGAGGGGVVASPTLMSRRLSLEMETAGFRVVQESSLRSVGEAIARWSPSAQWDRLTRPTAAEETSDGGHHHHHHRHEGAARALC